jgi:hypothetical protein
MTEDYPGQENERRREKLVYNAVTAGDRILMDGSDGSVEELDALTAEVASKWADKARMAAQARLRSKDMMEREKKS